MVHGIENYIMDSYNENDDCYIRYGRKITDITVWI